MAFVLPGAADRTTIVGATGEGKTILGGWLLSMQNLQKRPWVAIDFKNEELWDRVGDPPMRDLRVNQMPGKRGLYRLKVLPGQEDELEEWLWKIWERENVGLFCDEVSLVQGKAFKAILRTGRSKRIPIIACTQRPVDVDRELFSESQYKAVFSVEDERDLKIIKGFTRNAPIEAALPPRHSHWYDSRQRKLFQLKPCPPPDKIVAALRQNSPYSWFLS